MELLITSVHDKSIRGKTAGFSISGKSRYGGASQAAAFLKHFIGIGTFRYFWTNYD